MAIKFTNKLKLPKPLFQAIANDPYSGSGYTASMFAKPAQIIELEKRHDYTVDISDMIYPLVGNNTHYILERMGIKNALQEERLFAKVYGESISCQIDHYNSDCVLQDWKLTTRWIIVHGAKHEWIVQMNTQAFTLEANGFPVKKAEIIAIFRDWSKTQAAKNPLYPKRQVAVLPVELWSKEEQVGYLSKRIIYFKNASLQSDECLPECTPEERWDKPTVYAIMKKGRKSSVRNLFSLEHAQEYIDKNKLDVNIHSIQERLGESTRCEYYCNIKDFCHQYKRLKEAA